MTPEYDTVHRVDPATDGRTTLDLDALGRGVDVVLPDGEIRVGGRFSKGNAGAVRFRAAEGAAPTLVVPPDYNDFVVSVTGDHFVFDGIDVDLRADRAATGIRAHANTFLVRDVAFVGRGTHPADEVCNCLNLGVRDPEGTGVVRDVRAREGSSWARYKGGDGRVWAWVGDNHVGELRLQRCRVEEFGNNGLYGSEAPGRIVVENCEFWNNNVASIRLGSDGSAVRGTTVGIDPDRYAGPREPDHESDAFFVRGLWVEAKGGALDAPGRVAVDRSRVLVRGGEAGLPTGAHAVLIRPNAGALDVRDSDVRVEAPGVRPLLARRPGGADGVHAMPDPPYDLSLDRTRIVDTAPVGALVDVTGRDLTVGDGCCLAATADGTDGVVVTDGACTVGAATVAVPGGAVRAAGSDPPPDLAVLDTDGDCGGDGDWEPVGAAPGLGPVDRPGVDG